MDDRLSKIVFVPPQIGRQWHYDSQPDSAETTGGIRHRIPLFYSNPPWHRLCPTAADRLAQAIADRGIAVTALLRDLSGPKRLPSFHDQPRSRIIPYRPERYGLVPADFDAAEVIEFRLTLPRDDDGRFAYSTQQVSRWEAKKPDNFNADKFSVDAPPVDHGCVPAASFPPDVESLEQLSIKIQQLRALSGGAAVVVSMTPYRISEELPIILSQQPDGILLRCTENHFPALAIAKATVQAAAIIDQPSMPIWIHASGITPTDAVKLMHLGASGVSVDAWCDPIVDYVVETMKLGQHLPTMSDQIRLVTESRIDDVVEHMLMPYLDEFRGYSESIAGLTKSSRFAATDPAWSAALGLNLLD